MVLEACVIVVDNSEWTRNGDYSPSRLEAAKEAASYLANRKLASNVENCVAVMTMGGANGKCLLSLTSEQGKIARTISLIQNEEGCNLLAALKVAQIVLKHRTNTNQKQRIVAFVGSPMDADLTSLEALEDIGKKLKKNGIAVDLIDFGTENRGNTAVLEKLIEFVDSESQPSRLVTIPPAGPGLILMEAALGACPEMFERSSASSGGGAGGTDGFEFGVDSDMDPELAMALKLSMEEEIARQKKQQPASEESEQHADQDPKTNDMDQEDQLDEDEEMMMAKAIAMSMEQSKGGQ